MKAPESERRMFLPSGSKLELAETCIASAVIEGHDTVDAFTDLGNVKHAFYYNALEHGVEAALKLVPTKHLLAVASIDLTKLPAGQRGRWAGEVTFALNINTGVARELGRNLGRAYVEAGLDPEAEIAGTIDWLGMSPDRDAMIVVDAKSGFTKVTRAQQNLQLLFAGIGASDVYGRADVIGSIAYTRDDERPYFDTTEWSLYELEAARSRIIALGRRVLRARADYKEQNITPRMVTGEHCRWCSAQMTCPAQGALVRRMVMTPTDFAAEVEAGLESDDSAARTYLRLIAVARVVDNAIEVVKKRAAQKPIPLPDGEQLGLAETERETLDAEVVADVVREAYGDAAVIRAVEAKATKASVKRLARELKSEQGGTIKGYEDSILDSVRQKNGVVVTRKTTVQVHRPALPAGETK